jgi:radical SAM protein with 4Fe4S-binding SPASM domain
MRNNSKNSTGKQLPVLFSFITFRWEKFGALLYNPFLSADLEIDRIDAFMAGMFKGIYSSERIINETEIHFKLTKEESEKRFNVLTNKLRDIYGLHYIYGKESDSQYVPGSFTFPGKSHYNTPKSVLWDITYSCNLHCSHCLTNSGKKSDHELNTEESFQLIDKLVESKILNLSLVGGEPFIRPDIIQILRYLSKTKIRTSISTNGIHLPEKTLIELRDLPIFQIQVSIDGIGDTHDAFRGKKGAFKRACKNLVKIKNEGISTSINTTVTSKNIGELEKIIDLALDLGCDAYKAIPFLEAGRGRLFTETYSLSKHDSLRMSEIIIKKQKELSGKMAIYSESTFDFLLQPISEPVHINGAIVCSAGYDVLSIGADGTAYPCPFLQCFPLGNLLKTSMHEIWHESQTLNSLRSMTKQDMKGACKNCQYAPQYCHGGCRAAAYLTNKSLYETDPLCFKELIELQ